MRQLADFRDENGIVNRGKLYDSISFAAVSTRLSKWIQTMRRYYTFYIDNTTTGHGNLTIEPTDHTIEVNEFFPDENIQNSSDIRVGSIAFSKIIFDLSQIEPFSKFSIKVGGDVSMQMQNQFLAFSLPKKNFQRPLLEVVQLCEQLLFRRRYIYTLSPSLITDPKSPDALLLTQSQ